MAKKSKRFAPKSKVGSGKGFDACVKSVMKFYEKKGKSMTEERAKAICASIGRKKYGQKKMTKMAAAGKK